MMLKIRPIYFLVFIIFLFSCKSETEKIAERTAARNAIIDSTISSFEKDLLMQQIDSVFAKYDFNGSVLVAKNDEVLYEKANGFEDFRAKTQLTSNSVFAIASISKQFTGVLVLLQEEQGKLSVTDKVSKYLVEFQPKEFENITIKQLLNHTSGISDFGKGLLSKPGEKFHYSNKGFRFLGAIIEKVSGKSYDENLKDLFEKVGMKNTFTPNSFHGTNFASAFIGNPKKYFEVENMPKRLAESSISIAAGGILSTAQDMNIWNQSLYNGKILKQASLLAFKSKSADRNHPILGKMGYGFGIMMNLEKPNSYFHSGYVKGSPSLNIYYPETKTSVIILSNIADETLGKAGFFNPHKSIKRITDNLQKVVLKKRAEVEKAIFEKNDASYNKEN